MATLTIRNLDDEIYARLKRDAQANHRSIEAEARRRLGQSEQRISAEEMIARLRKVRIDPGPDYEGSVALIRSIRDEE
jgi:plasmid stability protein